MSTIIDFEEDQIKSVTQIDSAKTYISSSTKTANYTTVSTDQIIYVNSSGGAFTITLDAAPSTNKTIDITDINGSCSTYTVTIDGNGKNIIGNTTALMSANYISYTLRYNGTEWNII